jgi:hypothetical protein
MKKKLISEEGMEGSFHMQAIVEEDRLLDLGTTKCKYLDHGLEIVPSRE